MLSLLLLCHNVSTSILLTFNGFVITMSFSMVLGEFGHLIPLPQIASKKQNKTKTSKQKKKKC